MSANEDYEAYQVGRASDRFLSEWTHAALTLFGFDSCLSRERSIIPLNEQVGSKAWLCLDYFSNERGRRVLCLVSASGDFNTITLDNAS